MDFAFLANFGFWGHIGIFGSFEAFGFWGFFGLLWPFDRSQKITERDATVALPHGTVSVVFLPILKKR